MCGTQPEDLSAQITAKQRSIAAAKVEEEYYAQSSTLQDQILQTVEGMKAAQVRERHMDTVDYSLRNLRREQRREYDLSDPNAIKNDKLPDLDDPSLGPSSMLKFSSVDETPEDKHRRQQQTSSWLQAQMQEKMDREQEEKEYDRRYDERTMLASHVRAVCEENERQEARADKCAEAAENLELAKMVRDRNRNKAEFNDALKSRHVDTIRNSDWVSEAHDWKIGATGKLIRTEYKRLSIEEEQDVYNSNARQILDKRARQNAEALEQSEEAAGTRCAVAVLGAVEEERVNHSKNRRMRMVEENNRLAAAKRDADRANRAEYMSYDPTYY